MADNNDNDNDHSYSQLPVNKALTCPKGSECLAVAFPWLAKEIRPKRKEELNNVFGSDLLPLEVKWACICARKELRFTQDECVVRSPGCCFLDECPCCSCLGFAEVQSVSSSCSSVVFVLVVGVSRVRCLLVCCWLGCRGRVDRVVGRAVCLSLLLMTSLSTASHFEVSSALISQVMSLMKSLLVLSGCIWL